MAYFDKTYHPPGTTPGTLTRGQLGPGESLSIRLIDYTADEYLEQELTSVDECKPYLERESITWIHLQGRSHAEILQQFGDLFELHSLALEDILNTGQRPKVEEYDDLLFMILSMPYLRDNIPVIEQVSLFLGEGFLISFHGGSDDPFDPLRQRLQKKGSRLRQQQADYLLHGILDLVIDQGFPILEGFGEEIESIEEGVLAPSTKQATLARMHRIRRELLLLRRTLWPQREVVNDLLRSENPLINKDTLIYLRDCYDHTTQILELIENYREMAASLIDVYLSSSNYRLSEIMRVLTMIATIFIPLTFITGLYGMNFSNPESPWAMPELHWYYGYPITWGIMIAIVIGMVAYFKHKDWL